jgi:hypothetical protein
MITVPHRWLSRWLATLLAGSQLESHTPTVPKQWKHTTSCKVRHPITHPQKHIGSELWLLVGQTTPLVYHSGRTADIVFFCASCSGDVLSSACCVAPPHAISNPLATSSTHNREDPHQLVSSVSIRQSS